jgi:hypothetical protein
MADRKVTILTDRDAAKVREMWRWYENARRKPAKPTPMLWRAPAWNLCRAALYDPLSSTSTAGTAYNSTSIIGVSPTTGSTDPWNFANPQSLSGSSDTNGLFAWSYASSGWELLSIPPAPVAYVDAAFSESAIGPDEAKVGLSTCTTYSGFTYDLSDDRVTATNAGLYSITWNAWMRTINTPAMYPYTIQGCIKCNGTTPLAWIPANSWHVGEYLFLHETFLYQLTAGAYLELYTKSDFSSGNTHAFSSRLVIHRVA